MGVRCTLLGHDYDDSEIEREREESGDEAVVTIREVRICGRCGHRSVRSENKEVTSAAPPSEDESPTDDVDYPEPAPVQPPDETGDGPEHDPETDDGVILDDEDEEVEEVPEERQYGEWPDAEEDHGSAEADPRAGVESEPREWPDAEGDDEGYDAPTPDDEDPAAEYPRAPEDEVDLDGDAEPEQEATTDSDLQRAGEAAPPAGPATEATELHCPACGYRDPSRDGSLREGDICPECKQGYLAATE